MLVIASCAVLPPNIALDILSLTLVYQYLFCLSYIFRGVYILTDSYHNTFDLIVPSKQRQGKAKKKAYYAANKTAIFARKRERYASNKTLNKQSAQE